MNALTELKERLWHKRKTGSHVVSIEYVLKMLMEHDKQNVFIKPTDTLYSRSGRLIE
jgi:hypothetical protein